MKKHSKKYENILDFEDFDGDGTASPKESKKYRNRADHMRRKSLIRKCLCDRLNCCRSSSEDKNADENRAGQSCLFSSCCWIYSHPYVRLLFVTLALVLDYLIFYEDPLTYSNVLAEIPVLGTAYNHLFLGYPKLEINRSWKVLKIGSLVAFSLSCAILGEILGRRLILRSMLKLKVMKSRILIFILCVTNFILGVYASAVFYAWSINYKPIVESDWMRAPSEPKSENLGPNLTKVIFSRCSNFGYGSLSRTDLLESIPSNKLPFYNSSFALVAFYLTFLADTYTFFSICDSSLQDTRRYTGCCRNVRKNCWPKWRIVIFWMFLAACLTYVFVDAANTVKIGNGSNTYWQGRTGKKTHEVGKKDLENSSKHCSRLLETSSELLKIRNWYCHAVFWQKVGNTNGTLEFKNKLWFSSSVVINDASQTQNQRLGNSEATDSKIYEYHPLLEEVAVSRIENGKSLKNFDFSNFLSREELEFGAGEEEEENVFGTKLEPILPISYFRENGKEVETETPVFSTRGVFQSDELWRIILAVSILILNVIILTQEMDFPHFRKIVPNEMRLDDKAMQLGPEPKIPGWNSSNLRFFNARECKAFAENVGCSVGGEKIGCCQFGLCGKSLACWVKNPLRFFEKNWCCCCRRRRRRRCFDGSEQPSDSLFLEPMETFSESDEFTEIYSSSESSDTFLEIQNSKTTADSAFQKMAAGKKRKEKKSLITTRLLIYLSMSGVIVLNYICIYSQFSYVPTENGHVVDASGFIHPTSFEEYVDPFQMDFLEKNKTLENRKITNHYNTFEYHSLEVMCPMENSPSSYTNLDWIYKRIAAATKITMEEFISGHRLHFAEKTEINSLKSFDAKANRKSVFEENENILANWKRLELSKMLEDAHNGTVTFLEILETFKNVSQQNARNLPWASSGKIDSESIPIIWEQHKMVDSKNSKTVRQNISDWQKIPPTATHIFGGHFCMCGFKYPLDLGRYKKDFKSDLFDSKNIPDYFTKLASKSEGSVGKCFQPFDEETFDYESLKEERNFKKMVVETKSDKTHCRDSIEYSLEISQEYLESIFRMHLEVESGVDDFDANHGWATVSEKALAIVNEILWFHENAPKLRTEKKPEMEPTADFLEDLRCEKCDRIDDYYKHWKIFGAGDQSYDEVPQINSKTLLFHVGKKVIFKNETDVKFGVELTPECQEYESDDFIKSKATDRKCVLAVGRLNLKYVGISRFWKTISILPGIFATCYLVFRLILFQSYRSLYIWYFKRKEKNNNFENSERTKLGCRKKISFKIRFYMLKTCFCLRCKKPPRYQTP